MGAARDCLSTSFSDGRGTDEGVRTVIQGARAALAHGGSRGVAAAAFSIRLHPSIPFVLQVMSSVEGRQAGHFVSSGSDSNTGVTNK